MEQTATNPEGSGGLSLSEAATAFDALIREEPEAPTESQDAENVEATTDQPVSDLQPEELTEEGSEDGLAADVEDIEVEGVEETDNQGLYTVRVAGKEVEVPLHELIAGYSRTGDYLQKTQGVAEQRKQIEALHTQLETERNEYTTVLPQIHQLLNGFVDAMRPDPALMKVDPGMYLEQKEAFELHQNKIQAVQAEQARMAQINQAQFDQQQRTRLAEEQQRLIQAMPAWADPAVMQREQQQLVEYGSTIGYAPEELSNVVDHRAVATLRKAMLYDRAKTQGRKKAKTVPAKTATPGTTGQAGNTQSKREKQQWDKLRSTGKPTDAAPLFEAIFGQ
jgi:hypothetical protein